MTIRKFGTMSFTVFSPISPPVIKFHAPQFPEGTIQTVRDTGTFRSRISKSVRKIKAFALQACIGTDMYPAIPDVIHSSNLEDQSRMGWVHITRIQIQDIPENNEHNGGCIVRRERFAIACRPKRCSRELGKLPESNIPSDTTDGSSGSIHHWILRQSNLDRTEPNALKALLH